MKKVLLFCVAVAVALAMTVPAKAELKITSKGYMQVQGLYVDRYILEENPAGVSQDSSNAWYNMKALVDPILHVNDKVRLISQVAMLQRNYSGTGTGDLYATDAAQKRYNVFGDEQNNLWLEKLYLAFSLYGGTMYVGRMEGGNWAYPFADSDYNADRIRYMRSFGPYLFGLVIQKGAERDGGLIAPRFGNVTGTGTGFDQSYSDQDSYGLVAVIPFSKQIVWKPLFWYTDEQQAGPASTMWTLFLSDGFTFDFKPFRLDLEVDYYFGTVNNTGAPDNDIASWQIWGDISYGMGPFDVGLTGFWIQGSDHTGTDTDRIAPITTGVLYQPLLLLFSEDMGLLFSTRGVPNGSIENASGYQMYGAHAAYKLTDAMKFSGIFGYLRADKMENGFDKDLGMELDVSFEWAFMNNVKYIVDAGYLWTGDYFKDYSQANLGSDFSQDTWGVRHTIRVEW